MHVFLWSLTIFSINQQAVLGVTVLVSQDLESDIVGPTSKLSINSLYTQLPITLALSAYTDHVDYVVLQCIGLAPLQMQASC